MGHRLSFGALKYVVLLAGLLCGKAATVRGQNPNPSAKQDSAITQLINQADSVVVNHRKPVYRLPGVEGKNLSAYLTRARAGSSHSLYAAQRAELKAEKQVAKSDVGLRLTADYLENFKAGLFDVEGLFYRRRAKVGLKWDFLKNGLLDRHYNIKQLQREQKALHVSGISAVDDAEFNQLQQGIRLSILQQKRDMLRSYLQLLDAQGKIFVSLYHRHYKMWDDILDITARRTQANRQLKSSLEIIEELRNQQMAVIPQGKLPVYDLNFSMLKKAFRNQQSSRSSAKPIAAYHLWSDISLSARVQYNYFSDAPVEQLTGDNGKREFVSAGVNFSIPIPLGARRKKALVRARRRVNHFKAVRAKAHARDIPALFSHYQQILSAYERKLEEYKSLNETVRIQLVKKRMHNPAYSPLKVLHTLDERYQKGLRLISDKQKLYTQLLNIYQSTYQTPLSRYASPVKFEAIVDTSQFINLAFNNYRKSIYIWSSTFGKYKNTSLIDYLSEQHYSMVFLSAGIGKNRKKIRSFIRLAHQAGMRVELLVGNNRLFLPGHAGKLRARVKLADELNADGLHLDVEPQTLDDWHSSKNKYQKLYLKMARKAAREAHKKQLSLSLSAPVYFDAITARLTKWADSIQLMAYGMDDIAQLKRRVGHELKKAPDKTAIVLRASDFSDDASLTAFIKKIQNKLSFRDFSIHDLKGMLKMQDRNIN